MKKHEEIFNQNSCLNKAADDEPIFVLRANDPCAPLAVHNWAAFYANSRAPMTPAQMAKYDEAKRLAYEMEAWQDAHGIKPWR